MRRLTALLIVMGLSALVTAAPALQAESGWIREAPPTAPVRAGYVRLANAGTSDRVITSVSSPAFAAVEIHEMAGSSDGAMRMRPIPRLVIPAGESVVLEPGGLHLMLFRPTGPLASGQRVPVVFVLDDGGTLELELEQR